MPTSALFWGVVVGSSVAIYYTVRGWRAGTYEPDWGKVVELWLYGYGFVVGVRLLALVLYVAATHEPLEPLLGDDDKAYIGLIGVIMGLLSVDRILRAFRNPAGLG